MTVEQWGKIIAKIAYAENGCWIWTGAATTNRQGVRYPAVRINGKTQSVRRVLYEERYGAGTMTKRTTMSCGNMLCVNPEHVILTPPAVPHCAKARGQWRTRPLTGINGVRKLARLVGFRLRKERPGVYRVERVA